MRADDTGWGHAYVKDSASMAILDPRVLLHNWLEPGAAGTVPDSASGGPISANGITLIECTPIPADRPKQGSFPAKQGHLGHVANPFRIKFNK